MKKVNKPVKAYKGFNKHMQCTPNGKIFQYEIGKEYKEDEANLCYCGFHACENPLDVLSYYNNIDDKFCEVLWDFNENCIYLSGYRETFLINNIEIWAYLEDLLPNNKE